jgi:hypothetical protein
VDEHVAHAAERVEVPRLGALLAEADAGLLQRADDAGEVVVDERLEGNVFGSFPWRERASARCSASTPRISPA